MKRNMKNQYRHAFTLIELLVVIAIVSLLMGILLPALSKARDLAKDIACRQHLSQWALIFTMYTSDNDHRFFSAVPDEERSANRWMQATESYCNNDKARMCPKAQTITHNDDGLGTTTSAWQACTTGLCTISGMGSYGINRWISYPDNNYSTLRGAANYPAENYFGKVDSKNPSQIPVFLDAAWFEAAPKDTDTPSQTEDQMPPAYRGRGLNEIQRFTLNRHAGSVNAVFLDMSNSKVGLKKLWTLKWHQNFNTKNNQTKPNAYWHWINTIPK